ncbi:MAG TPA: hypothetical protein PK883_03885 [Anaerolineaceae bacterium]|nr:hypothetical protein [Anaerolineaceae bacterium]
MMTKDVVRCRAEHAYPGRPLEVWSDGRWQPVKTVLEEMFTPEGKRYHVICETTNEYNLLYDPDRDTWLVQTAGSTGNLKTQEIK